MANTLLFGEMLEAIDTLPLEDQEAFADVLHRRIIEYRRDQLVSEIQEAQQEFREGHCHAATSEEIMKKILP